MKIRFRLMYVLIMCRLLPLIWNNEYSHQIHAYFDYLVDFLPLIGTTMASSCGTCWSNSKAIVPWPLQMTIHTTKWGKEAENIQNADLVFHNSQTYHSKFTKICYFKMSFPGKIRYIKTLSPLPYNMTIVERMDHSSTSLFLHITCLTFSWFESWFTKEDLSSVPFHIFDLAFRRIIRHHNICRNISHLCGQSHCSSMVPTTEALISIEYLK